MSRKIVHMIGTGTIGEPLIGILSGRREELGIEEVSFQPEITALRNKALIKGLISRGAKLCVDEEYAGEFTSAGLKIECNSEEAIRKAAVIIDCSILEKDAKNKRELYLKYSEQGKTVIAQSITSEFGKNYAYGINDGALVPGKDQFIRIVSCNAQNIAALVKTLSFDNNGQSNLEWGRFVCIRRASDISEEKLFIPSPEVGTHYIKQYGTHHALDAASLFKTLGYDLDLFSSSMRVNSQYLHIVHFNIKLKENITLQKVINRFEENKLIALTNKTLSSLVFSFVRDMGYLGRILNQSVISVSSLNVNNGNEITGFCFTPQDGNSLLSSIAATLWCFFPRSYREKLQNLSDLIFDEI